MHPSLEAGDVLVADRGFCSYGHIARLHRRGVDLVFRMHQRQIVDFTPGRPHAVGKKQRQRGLPRSRWIRALGQTDQIVGWTKPATCPTYLSRERWAALPEEVTVREVRYRVETAGYRTREVTLVTTLLDARTFSSEALAELYLLRGLALLGLEDAAHECGTGVPPVAPGSIGPEPALEGAKQGQGGPTTQPAASPTLGLRSAMSPCRAEALAMIRRALAVPEKLAASLPVKQCEGFLKQFEPWQRLANGESR